MLWRKMRRDLWENRAAYLACIVVIAIGLMVFTMTAALLENLGRAREVFYREYRFADGFARVRGISSRELDLLRQVEGLADVEGRAVRDVQVLFPGRRDNVYLRLVSIPAGPGIPLNGIMVLGGEPLKPGASGIWLTPSFLEANGLGIGQVIRVVAGGRKAELKVLGTGQSPEYLYAMRTPQDIYPDPMTFGVAYVPSGIMESLFGSGLLFNELTFALEDGVSYEEVEGRLKARLARYGLESIYPGKDHLSEVILSQELMGLESMAGTLPLLFLFIAAVIMYIMLKRTVEQQRGQIGTLKAFGYFGRQIVLHYLAYTVVVGAAGGLLGGLAGIGLSFPMTELYKKFFHLPGLEGRFSANYLFSGVMLSLLFSVSAGWFGARGALLLQPAEAMRPPAPPAGGRVLLERWRLYWSSLTVQGKMATRNLFRNKARMLLTLFGIMFAYSLIATTWYFQLIADVLVVEQFENVQTYDAKVTFTRPLPLQAAQIELSRQAGVTRAEAVLEVPALLRNSWREKGAVIMGLAQDARLYNILTKEGKRIDLPESGILLSERLAKELSAGPGSVLEVKSYFAGDEPVRVEVAGVVPQYVGLNAYMEIGALSRLLLSGPIATSAMLAAEPGSVSSLQEKYRDSELVSSVEDSRKMLEVYHELMESYGYMIWILALFAFVTAFAVIYNSSIVSLSERRRELATLLVLGMTPAEVRQVLTFEQWFVSIFGMLCGVPLTLAFLHGMAGAMQSDLFSLPVRFELFPYVFGAIGTAFSIAVAQWAVAGKIRRLSLVEVLKERD